MSDRRLDWPPLHLRPHEQVGTGMAGIAPHGYEDRCFAYASDSPRHVDLALVRTST